MKTISEKKIDWAAEAKFAVGYTSDEMFPCHRGAMPWRHPEITVVYGNDGLADDQRAKDGLADVKSFLFEHGIKELGFATAHDGYFWAMLVRSAGHEALEDLLWEARSFDLREAQLNVIRATSTHSDRTTRN